MQKVDFIKMHGLGNDFVIIDKRSNNIAITEDIIKRLSDRRTGAGCDQLITINNTSNQIADAEIEYLKGSPLKNMVSPPRRFRKLGTAILGLAMVGLAMQYQNGLPSDDSNASDTSESSDDNAGASQ